MKESAESLSEETVEKPGGEGEDIEGRSFHLYRTDRKGRNTFCCHGQRIWSFPKNPYLLTARFLNENFLREAAVFRCGRE